MTPESQHILTKSRELLGEAKAMLGIGLAAAAGRTAYLASLHAARALISERTGKVPKTHGGAHSQFHELTAGDRNVDTELRSFLSRGYDLKSIADYGAGPGSEISIERASHAIGTAARFVAYVENAISTDD